MRYSGLVYTAALLTAGVLASCSPGESEITLEEAWLREPPSGAPTAAVYLTIANTGTRDDALSAVSTPAAGHASVHTTREEDGMMRMRPVDSLPIPAGERVVLDPGGHHIMLEDLVQRPEAGTHISLTLTFEGAGERRIEVPVRAMDARGPKG